MLRRPKRSKNEVVVPKKEEEWVDNIKEEEVGKWNSTKVKDTKRIQICGCKK
jgi:hypothetical protein